MSSSESPRPSCRCGHDHEAHEHLRRGTDCSRCDAGECTRYRARRWWHGRPTPPPQAAAAPEAATTEAVTTEAVTTEAVTTAAVTTEAARLPSQREDSPAVQPAQKRAFARANRAGPTRGS